MDVQAPFGLRTIVLSRARTRDQRGLIAGTLQRMHRGERDCAAPDRQCTCSPGTLTNLQGALQRPIIKRGRLCIYRDGQPMCTLWRQAREQWPRRVGTALRARPLAAWRRIGAAGRRRASSGPRRRAPSKSLPSPWPPRLAAEAPLRRPMAARHGLASQSLDQARMQCPACHPAPDASKCTLCVQATVDAGLQGPPKDGVHGRGPLPKAARRRRAAGARRGVPGCADGALPRLGPPLLCKVQLSRLCRQGRAALPDDDNEGRTRLLGSEHCPDSARPA